MNAAAKERQALASVLDKCVADLESKQREQLRQHRLHVEEVLSQQFDLLSSKRDAPFHEDEEKDDVAEEGISKTDRLLQPTFHDEEEEDDVADEGISKADRLVRPSGHEQSVLPPNDHEDPESLGQCSWICNGNEDSNKERLRIEGTEEAECACPAPRPQRMISTEFSSATIVSESSPNHRDGATSRARMERMRSHVSMILEASKATDVVAPFPKRKSRSANQQQSTSFFFPEDGFVHGTFFNLISALLIVGNAIFIGLQTHVQLQNSLTPSSDDGMAAWRPWEVAFLVVFAAELGARICTDKVDFLKGVEWRWNMFDSFIVGVSIVEIVAESILSEVGVSFPFLRLVRVVRVLRVLKVLHMVPFFRRLGLMMTSVSASLSALAPAFVVLILLIYLFGICLMQGIIQFVVDNETTPLRTKIQERFGSVGVAMKTLFMSITNGISWVECLEVTQVLGPFYEMVLLFYIFFVQICVLNIVTGVFVDTVHQMYRPEREEMVQREMNKRKQMLNLIRSIFEDADEDGSGTITWEEFQDCLSDEQIMLYLSALEIDITQAREIFEILDSEGSNEVSIDEVVLGFVELKGAAKGADLVILRHNVCKMMGRMAHFMMDTTKNLGAIKDAVEESRRDFWIVGGGLEKVTFAGGAQPPASGGAEEALSLPSGDESTVKGI